MIASPDLIFNPRDGAGFIGTYKHIPGNNMRDKLTDATIIAIADELIAMQSASRLLVGKFFFASMNNSEGKMVAEIFYDEQFAGQSYKLEIKEPFLALMRRFAEWLTET